MALEILTQIIPPSTKALAIDNKTSFKAKKMFLQLIPIADFVCQRLNPN
jgi:hypothetical protein